jgi:hypothetical protein
MKLRDERKPQIAALERLRTPCLRPYVPRRQAAVTKHAFCRADEPHQKGSSDYQGLVAARSTAASASVIACTSLPVSPAVAEGSLRRPGRQDSDNRYTSTAWREVAQKQIEFRIESRTENNFRSDGIWASHDVL